MAEPVVPFTLSHAAAVLPLRRCCPHRLNFAALIVGSLAPDIPHYLPDFAGHWAMHSLGGSIALCMPAGLLLLALFHPLKQPLCLLLPQPHRAALLPLASGCRQRPGFGCLAIAAVSVLLGAWTHLIWDSLTHRGAWGPRHLPFLDTPIFSIGGQVFALYACLQWLSSVIGMLILACAYRNWLRRQAAPPAGGDERWRQRLLAGLGLAALAGGLPFALARSAAFHGFTACMVFLFQLWVHFAVMLAGLLALSALLLSRLKRLVTPPP